MPDATPSDLHIDSYGGSRKGAAMATLTTEEREKLPSSAFAIPDKREYPIHDQSHAANALSRASGKPEEGKVKAAVHSKYPALKKSDAEIVVPIWKDESKQIVYGVVLEPDQVDSQGDIVSPQEIEKAAHTYLADSRRSDVQHNEMAAGVDVVESYVAPCDLEVAGQRVQKGAWVIAHKIHDSELWGRICKGELTGYSIGGSGVRLAEEA
jgi:hypothetical protein